MFRYLGLFFCMIHSSILCLTKSRFFIIPKFCSLFPQYVVPFCSVWIPLFCATDWKVPQNTRPEWFYCHFIYCLSFRECSMTLPDVQCLIYVSLFCLVFFVCDWRASLIPATPSWWKLKSDVLLLLRVSIFFLI